MDLELACFRIFRFLVSIQRDVGQGSYSLFPRSHANRLLAYHYNSPDSFMGCCLGKLRLLPFQEERRPVEILECGGMTS